MKSRIPKIWLSLALAVTVSCCTYQAVRTPMFSNVTEGAMFYANVPARLYEVVTNLKTLPQRMDPTCSECNQF